MPVGLELIGDRIECPKEVVAEVAGLLKAAGIANTSVDVVVDGDHVISEVQIEPRADPKRVVLILAQVTDLPQWYLELETCEPDTATVPFDMSSLLEKE